MAKGMYTIEDFFIGDKVIFISQFVNTDFYWIVTGINEQTKELYIKSSPESLREDYWTLKVDEVRMRIPSSKERPKTS